jgi:hypothetical protein
MRQFLLNNNQLVAFERALTMAWFFTMYYACPGSVNFDPALLRQEDRPPPDAYRAQTLDKQSEIVNEGT